MGNKQMKNKLKIYIGVFALLIIICTQITIYIIPPIGAIPEGKTLIITRLNNSEFIDSPDAMCERIQSGVSLLCRGMIIAAVIKNSTILLRLPYSSWLYDISTDGKKYEH